MPTYSTLHLQLLLVIFQPSIALHREAISFRVFLDFTPSGWVVWALARNGKNSSGLLYDMFRR